MTTEEFNNIVSKAAKQLANDQGITVHSISFLWQESLGSPPYIAAFNTESSVSTTYTGMNSND